MPIGWPEMGSKRVTAGGCRYFIFQADFIAKAGDSDAEDTALPIKIHENA